MIKFTKNRILCGLLALCATLCLPEKALAQGGVEAAWANSLTAMTVSYTHLTLPTIYSV